MSHATDSNVSMFIGLLLITGFWIAPIVATWNIATERKSQLGRVVLSRHVLQHTRTADPRDFAQIL